MALLQNITLRAQYPIRESGGTTGFERSSCGRLERQMNRFAGSGGLSLKAAIPYGYLHPSALAMPRVSGGVGATGTVYGAGSTTASNLAGGLAALAALVGSGSVTPAPSAQLLAFLLASLSGGGLLDAVGKLVPYGVVAMTGGGTVTTAALLARGHLEALLTGSGSATLTLEALGELQASILSYGALTPEGIRDSVWNAAAATYNDAGSMGNKLNSASAAGDPWTAELPGTYATGSAGKLLSDMDDKADDAALVLAFLQQMEAGRWKMVGNQMIFYDADGTTPLRTFNLTDASGNPTMANVYERVPT